MNRSLLSIAAVFACAGAALASPAPVASPAPKASTSCDVPVGDDYIPMISVFAYYVSDKPTLRFIAKLAAVPDKEQAGRFRKIAKSESTVSGRVRAAVARACAGSEVAYRARRAIYTTLNRWDFDTLDPLFAAFSERLTTAVAAIEARDSIAPADLDAALAPFGMRMSDLQQPAFQAALPCIKPNESAKVRKAFDIAYPEFAGATNTSGIIKVKVLLDDEGLIRSTSVDSTDVKGPSAAALADAVVFAAAETTYDPEIVDCKPADSAYIFAGEFTISS